MATRQEAFDAWKQVIDSRQPRTAWRRGLLGDGGGTVDVEGLQGWAWIRYQEEQNKLSMVRCRFSYSDDTPVLVGKFHVDDDFEQVLSVDWGPYFLGLSSGDVARYATAPHGETHHGTYGSDPAYIDLNNLVVGRVKATNPESLFVIVESFSYALGNEVKSYGGDVIDLSGSVPGAAGHRFVFVYFDLATEGTATTDGDIAPLAVASGVPPLADFNAIPLGLVDLEFGQTAIADFTNIWQSKLILGSVGGQALSALEAAVVHEGEVVTHNGEIVWAT